MMTPSQRLKAIDAQIRAERAATISGIVRDVVAFLSIVAFLIAFGAWMPEIANMGVK